MSDLAIGIISAGSVIGALLIFVFIMAIVRETKGRYEYNHVDNVTSNEEDLGYTYKTKAEREQDELEREIEFTEVDEEEMLASGVDALKGRIKGPWRSVIASVISANRGVSREHLGYAPVTQVLNQVSPANKNVSINLDKDQLEDFLGYVKVLETSLDKPEENKGATPQDKYRMLQKAFEDKRDLDTTTKAREHSREVIRQEKIDSRKLITEEQLAKMDSEISGRVDSLLEDNPSAADNLEDFREEIKGRGLLRRKSKKQKEDFGSTKVKK